jgi:hypothetical protein
MNSKTLFQTKALVKEILEENKLARNSDTYLYLQVLYRVGQLKGINIKTMSIVDFLLRSNELGFPPYKTVERTRRTLKNEHPELAGNASVEEQRKINERVYRDYAKSKSIKIGE